MISINATMLIQVINFLILVFILNRLMLRPILKLIQDRSKHIEKIGNEIKEIVQKSHELVAEYASTENEARKNAMEERAMLKMDAVTKADDIFSGAKNDILSIRKDVDSEIRMKIEKIRPSLKKEAEDLVDVIIEKIVGRRIAA